MTRVAVKILDNTDHADAEQAALQRAATASVPGVPRFVARGSSGERGKCVVVTTPVVKAFPHDAQAASRFVQAFTTLEALHKGAKLAQGRKAYAS